ncbi:hypothetical protein EDEG_02875 [Edhazardia aedis USNM 41457]|uniref:Glucosamine/galactosamine-6-phosphate isomerase domain-containing protein n=1 Tax=Edhazardia aedis (strain USNM 41457) TaxID=1003232 RepID=J9D4K5_EDHAE|nr:hypothetical protein EDEG_02875 [Edhazardia aedis USNM 41457]|eukprot:EJW02736.1 hypothetical protein EDEG_02875 [Edhazardia aedis USNM 41457]
MHNYYKTNDFSQVIYSYISPYNGKKANILVSGGSVLPLFQTPEIIGLDSSKWHVYLSDERITSDPQLSNFRDMELYFTNINCVLHPLKPDLVLPKFEVGILGVGEDGHVASLFPNHKILDSTKYIEVIDDSPKYPPKRITVTIMALKQVKELVFLTPPKNGVIKNVFKPHHSIINRINHDLTFVVPTLYPDEEIIKKMDEDGTRAERNNELKYFK